jgi:hypothetical protein
MTERCPTCKSHDQKIRGYLDRNNEFVKHPKGCSDPWHDSPAQPSPIIERRGVCGSENKPTCKHGKTRFQECPDCAGGFDNASPLIEAQASPEQRDEVASLREENERLKREMSIIVGTSEKELLARCERLEKALRTLQQHYSNSPSITAMNLLSFVEKALAEEKAK